MRSDTIPVTEGDFDHLLMFLLEGNNGTPGTIRGYFASAGCRVNRRSFYRVLASDSELRQAYLEIRASSAFENGDRVLEIADKLENGELEAPQAAQMIQAIKWHVERVNTRFWGPKQEVTVTNKVEDDGSNEW